MANFTYREARRAILEGEIDLVDDDLRILIVMTNTTADTELTAEFVGDLTVLDEYDGTGYTRQTVDNRAIAIDNANDRVEVTADPAVFSSIGAGTRQGQAAIVYKQVTNDADSPLLFHIDSNGFPFTGTGADFPVNFSAQDGMVRL